MGHDGRRGKMGGGVVRWFAACGLASGCQAASGRRTDSLIVRGSGELLAQLADLAADALLDTHIIGAGEDVADPLADLVHFRLVHAAGRQRRRADTDARRIEWFARVEPDAVAGDRDAGRAEGLL